MKIIHGNRFYALHSRNVGTFGSVARRATVKIYRSDSANAPACVLDAFAQIEEFHGLIEGCGDDRAARDKIMEEFVSFGG